MTTTIREFPGELVVLRCWCGIQHAVPQSLRNEQLRQHDRSQRMEIYCPLGHQHAPGGKSDAQILREQLEAERARHQNTRTRADMIERSRNALRGVVTKVKKRVGNGVCPCCNRSFVQLRRHMATKHPDYVGEGAK